MSEQLVEASSTLATDSCDVVERNTVSTLWLRWVFANAWGELLGLGATFGIGATVFSGLAEAQGLVPALVTAVVMTTTGALEGTIVGLAQWSVLRHAIPGLARGTWILATVFGAVLAWLLGSIPMTVAALSIGATSTPVEEPSQGLVLALAGVLGLVAGLILSVVQWRVLEKHVSSGWRWLPANAVAWAAGMPLIFLGIDLAERVGRPAYAIIVVGSMIAFAGAIVGAIHGLVLVRFVAPRDS